MRHGHNLQIYILIPVLIDSDSDNSKLKLVQVLSAGPSLLKQDPRYSVAGPRSRGRQLGAELSVAQVTIEDAGEFVCQVRSGYFAKFR